jgi:hypothetical protein
MMHAYFPELFADVQIFWLTALFLSLTLALLPANAGLITHWKYSKRTGYIGMAAMAVFTVSVVSIVSSVQ